MEDQIFFRGRNCGADIHANPPRFRELSGDDGAAIGGGGCTRKSRFYPNHHEGEGCGGSTQARPLVAATGGEAAGDARGVDGGGAGAGGRHTRRRRKEQDPVAGGGGEGGVRRICIDPQLF